MSAGMLAELRPAPAGHKLQPWKVVMTAKEPRVKVPREPRRQMNAQPALMTVGSKQCECVVLDVSPGGAKIVTDVAIDVSDQFALSLVQSHAKRQPCEVVWRRGRTYGVKFLM